MSASPFARETYEGAAIAMMSEIVGGSTAQDPAQMQPPDVAPSRRARRKIMRKRELCKMTRPVAIPYTTDQWAQQDSNL